MSNFEELMEFENKFPFLYDFEINGFALYTVMRDHLVSLFSNNTADSNAPVKSAQKGRIYPVRIIDGMVKMHKFRNAESLVFTSSVYRRDRGRNLAAEYLCEKYPNTVVFEWPSRVEAFDKAYFSDPNKNTYCPLDFYLLVYKICKIIRKKEYCKLMAQFKQRLEKAFAESSAEKTEKEAKVIEYLLDAMPRSYAESVISQQIFRRLFKNYKHIDYAIDFWGSGRENIIPVLPGDFQSVELQHGVITGTHSGYIYPKTVGKTDSKFWNRKLLVFSTKEKEILTKQSIFSWDQIEIIGNPRISMYKKLFSTVNRQRKMILFTSQPFEQDGKGINYYSSMLPHLLEIEAFAKENDYVFGIKLHPREDNGIEDFYKQNIKSCVVFSNSSELYELLAKTRIHVTANSTVLFEAAAFEVPTITINYAEFDPHILFNDKVYSVDFCHDITSLLYKLEENDEYQRYLKYLQTYFRA